MSAGPSHAAEPHPLREGASPRVAGDWLPVELCRRFVHDYEAVLGWARCDLDLEVVLDVVER